MKAEIIAVGSEMLGAQRLDTNSLFLTEQLNRLGIDVRQKTVVGDDQAEIAAAVGSALQRADLVLVTGGSNEAEAREALNELTRRLEMALGDNIFSADGQTLEEVAGMFLTMKGKTIATAESCTGGLLAERLTRVPGSSRYFLGGLISYHNEVKARWLEVPRTVLEACGAVSPETARIMAESARRKFGADYALAVTGIAGPSGATPTKPVGLVYVALAESGRQPEVLERRYPGTRDRIRQQASQTALDMLRRRVR